MTGFLGDASSGGWSIKPASLAQATTASLASLLATSCLLKREEKIAYSNSNDHQVLQYIQNLFYLPI